MAGAVPAICAYGLAIRKKGGSRPEMKREPPAWLPDVLRDSHRAVKPAGLSLGGAISEIVGAGGKSDARDLRPGKQVVRGIDIELLAPLAADFELEIALHQSART